LLLALPAVAAACALAQEHPNVQPSTVRDQLMKQTPGSQPQPAAPPQAPASSPAPPQTPKKAPAPSKAPAAPAKSPAKTPAKETTQKAETKPSGERPAEQKPGEQKPGPRRDPFETLLNNSKADAGPPANLPPGKAGLLVGSLRIDGIVHGSNGMIAIVSNPQQRVYFLREGDKLYDGSIERITLEAITFHELGKDAFGKTIEREVTKRLYPSPGEQQ
jgi:hypothetical protein